MTTTPAGERGLAVAILFLVAMLLGYVFRDGCERDPEPIPTVIFVEPCAPPMVGAGL